jgi:hypothetical protein
MTYEEELKERFANMDILELEDIIRNKKNEYTEEAYAIASEQFNKRYKANPDIIFQAGTEKATEEILDEIDKKRNPPMKWYWWIICIYIPATILNLCSLFVLPESGFVSKYIYAIEVGFLVASEFLIIKRKKLGVNIFLVILSLEALALLSLAEVWAAIANAIFIALNWVYFNRRKHLFN